MPRSDQAPDFLTRPTAHLCVDMQRMFAEETPWRAPWMDRVRPVAERLVSLHPGRTVFTRFMPPERAEDAVGCWADYYRKWHQFTGEEAEPGIVDLVPELARFVPPAAVFDKPGYSAFSTPDLLPFLRKRGVETLIVTGTETDVCVLSSVMSAVDHGFRVVLAKDAMCSSTDDTHDALIALYAQRFGLQVALTTSEAIEANWRA